MFSAPIARLIRSVGSAALSSGMVALLANINAVTDLVTDAFGKIGIANENVVIVIVVAALASGIQAADKWLRDNGVYPNPLEK